jgi:hypothetical protein
MIVGAHLRERQRQTIRCFSAKVDYGEPCDSHSIVRIFWDVTPCNLVEVGRHFTGAYCLNLLHGRTNQAGCLLLELLFDPEDGGSEFLRNASEFILDYMTSHLRRLYSL